MTDGHSRSISIRTWIAIGVGVALVVAALIWMARPGSDDPQAPRVSVSAEDGCGGVDFQRIELNAQVIDPTDTFCFIVDEDAEVTVGAAALDATQSLVLEVSDANGALLGRAESADGADPQVVLLLAPGTYTGDVSTPGQSEAEPFLVYTAAFPPSGPDVPDTPNPGVELPAVADCGSTIPVLAHGDRWEGSSGATLACLDITETSFVKVGAQTGDPDANPDLQLAIYRAQGDTFTLIRTNDDAFGLDPELSFDAAPGVYVIATYAWFGEPTGDFTLYVDTEGTTWREDYRTQRFATVTDSTCDGSPALTPGNEATLPAGQPLVCLDIETAGRYTLTVVSEAGDSLAMEVLRPSPGGAPVRLAYTDLDPYATDPSSSMILIDATFPEGTLVVGVFSWFVESAPGAYTVSLEPSAPR